MPLGPEDQREALELRDKLLDLQHELERTRSDYHDAIRRLSAGGASLREIAEALGLSHQRVHQIVDTPAGGSPFPPPWPFRGIPRPGGRRGEGFFTRFTSAARETVARAEEEAKTASHTAVGTVHLLLGLLRVEGEAQRVLSAVGVELEPARAAVAGLGKPGDPHPSGRVPFTADAKRALERAFRAAHAAGARTIDTEHILRGVLDEEDGPTPDALARVGITREQVLAKLDEPPPAA